MYLSNIDLEQVVKTIEVLQVEEQEAVLLLLAEKNKIDIHQLISNLNQRGINFFGGVFPAVIYGNRSYEEGAIITVLPVIEKPYLIKGLDSEELEIPAFEEMGISEAEKKYTAIVLVDGFTSHIDLFLSEIFNRLGNSIHYFGGGAGSLSLKQEKCLFTNEGFVQDAAVVTFVKLESKLGVRHGYKRIIEPIVATKTHKNIISELNWMNAFDVYKDIVEKDFGKRLLKENFYNVSMEYPFGMYREGAEDIVRDPIGMNEEKELICVGEVPENTVLAILKGSIPALIQAAGQAASDCLEIKGKKITHCLVADCVSRKLFLKEDFSKELESVKEKISGKCIPEGMLSIGEISLMERNRLEFFNKTIVVGVLYD